MVSMNDVSDETRDQLLTDKDRLLQTFKRMNLKVVEEKYELQVSELENGFTRVLGLKQPPRSFTIVRLPLPTSQGPNGEHGIDAEFVFNADGSFKYLNHLVSEDFAKKLAGI